MATAVALSACIGCGDGDQDASDAKPARASHPLAGELAAWRSAAISYNAVLKNCQPYPENGGVIPACTRKWRRNYDRAYESLARKLRSARPSSPDCARLLVRAKSLSSEVTNALTRAYEAHSALERSVSGGDEYRGPPVLPLLDRADKITLRDSPIASDLESSIRRTC